MTHTTQRLTCAALAALVTLSLVASTADADPGTWEVLKKEKGITTFTREVEGRSLPSLKGQVLIKASIYEVMAILQDFDGHKEWMANCHSSKLLKEVDPYTRLSYNRTDAPWPVSDRDTVITSKVKINKQRKQVRISFRNVSSPLMPEVEDVVRMPTIKGYYLLVAKGPDKTFVVYEVDADPGGSLPDWLAEKASEDLPFNTLGGLRAQVKAVDFKRYEAFIQKWDPRHNPDSPGPALE